MKWYLVNVQENCENVAKKSIEEEIRSAHLEEFFGSVFIPREENKGSENGANESNGDLFFPGFVFVHMVLNEQTLTVVRKSPQVTDISMTNKRKAA